ncbi:MAG: S41 family peptidase [Bacteroidota bacterium]
MNLRYLLAIFVLLAIAAGCKKDDPDPDPADNKDPNGQVVPIPEASAVKKFIYNGLSTYYLWEADVPKLNNAVYNKNKDSLNAFLNQYDDPEALFYSLLYKYRTIDKWSYIVDDSKEIDDWIAGISETMGYNFGLVYISANSSNILGYVRYVIKGSPADQAGIKRGDLFMTINGTQLTDKNYQELLFTQKTYTIGFATESGAGNFVLNGKTATMTAVELQENPIHMDTILNVNGLKVGYLVYNSFNGSYDKTINTSYNLELNKVFGKFKNQGIDKLIIDLRYNPGGGVLTAAYLASMIYSTDPAKIFAKYKFNQFLQNYYLDRYGESYFNEYFESKIAKTDKTPEQSINSLGLNEVYIITTGRSASASELLINSLKVYLNVIQVGEPTSGKYVGSFTIKDYDNAGNLNTTHKWAMQPITLKINNANNASDYVNGLQPTLQSQYVFYRLQPFGDPEEQLLKVCLDHIKGLKSAAVSPGVRLREYHIPEGISPDMNLMYVDPERFELPRLEEISRFGQN